VNLDKLIEVLHSNASLIEQQFIALSTQTASEV